MPFPLSRVMLGFAHGTHITSPLLNFHEHPLLEQVHVAKVLTFTSMFNWYPWAQDTDARDPSFLV